MHTGSCTNYGSWNKLDGLRIAFYEIDEAIKNLKSTSHIKSVFININSVYVCACASYYFLLGILARKSSVLSTVQISPTSLENERNARNLWLPVK